MMAKIFIIGAGAIGRALAVFLKQANRDVVMLRARVDNLPETIEEVEVSTASGEAIKANITFSSLSNFETLTGIVVLTNKSFANPAVAKAIKSKIDSAPIVLLQNGLHVEEPFVETFPSVYRCVLFATSQMISESGVRFKPVATSPIGVIKGGDAELKYIVSLLNTDDFRFSASNNIHESIWKKVIANCVFNSICPLLEIDNGIFHRDSGALGLATIVIGECVKIAHASNIQVEEKEIVETVLMISKSSDGQLISTLQDIRGGRETEIKSLNFAIVKLAQELNLGSLVSVTRAFGELVEIKAKISSRK